MITEATATIQVLFCNSAQVGQDTLVINSLYDSSMYVTIFAISFLFLHGRRDSNSRHLVLETSALPTELHPFIDG